MTEPAAPSTPTPHAPIPDAPTPDRDRTAAHPYPPPMPPTVHPDLSPQPDRHVQSVPQVPAMPAPPAGPYQAGWLPDPARMVPTYLVQAVLVTLFCFMPLGLVAIVHAARVQAHLEHGDYARARQSSRQARSWCWWSLGVAVGAMVLFGLFVMASIVMWVGPVPSPTMTPTP